MCQEAASLVRTPDPERVQAWPILHKGTRCPEGCRHYRGRRGDLGGRQEMARDRDGAGEGASRRLGRVGSKPKRPSLCPRDDWAGQLSWSAEPTEQGRGSCRWQEEGDGYREGGGLCTRQAGWASAGGTVWCCTLRVALQVPDTARGSSYHWAASQGGPGGIKPKPSAPGRKEEPLPPDTQTRGSPCQAPGQGRGPVCLLWTCDCGSS